MTFRLTRFVAAAALAAASLLTGSLAQAAGGEYPLDHFPQDKLNNLPSLQRGAQLFVNYCLGCHSANYMRYNRLADIGLTDDLIKENLLFTGTKVGDQMRIAMSQKDAKEWLGAAPPDLSVIARARSSGAGSGSDWLYTFLRSYYRDDSKATGWNNALFPNVGMPHVLWTLQGQRGAETLEPSHHGEGHGDGPAEAIKTTYDNTGAASQETVTPAPGVMLHKKQFTFGSPVQGSMNSFEYDEAVGDLVAYLTYMSDPTAKTRNRLGVWVLLFISIFFVVAWMLNKAFWKDIK